MNERQPRWFEGVPTCAEDDCPSFDGKRCGEMGFKPDRICEPQVRVMSTSLALIAKGSLLQDFEMMRIARAALKDD